MSDEPRMEDVDMLEISDGEMAPSAWVRMVQSTGEEEKATIRRQLPQYCHLDTWALVMILGTGTLVGK